MTNTSNHCPLCHGNECLFFFQDTKNAKHSYQHCPNCDLVFVEPSCRLDQQAEKSRYDMHQNDGTEQHYVDFLSRLATPMLNHLPNSQAEGLDFGSGKSQAMANLFRQAGHSCQCYDIFYYPDNELLKQQYDFIVASEVIEHLYDPKTIFEQWLSMLNPNGLLGIMTGFRPAPEAFPNWWYKNDPTHVMLFSEKSFAYLEEHYSLKVKHQSKNVLVFSKPY